MRAIAANVLRRMARSRALALCCGAMTVLLALAAIASWMHQRDVAQQRDHFNQLVRSQWLQQPDRHPHRVSHYGYLAFRPRSPLSFWDSGVESHAGTAVFLEAHRQNPANFAEAGQSPAMMRLGELTPALVLQLFAPLLIIFLGFANVSGERENGTLELTLAQGTAPRVLLFGHALGLIAATAVSVAPGCLIALGLALAGTSAEVVLRLMLLGGAYTAFLAGCALWTVTVSAWRPSSRAALTALLLAWVAGAVILPRALQAWGVRNVPAPSRAEFEEAVEADLAREGDSHDANDPHFAALRARVLAEHRVAKVEDLPFNYSALVMKESEAISSAIFQRHYGRLIESFRRQGEPLDWGALVNPYLAIRRISSALAGSDLRHFLAFQQQAEAFRFDMIQRLNDVHLREIAMRYDRAQRVSSERWQSFPAFEFRPPALGELATELVAPSAALVLWMAVPIAALRRRRLP